MRPICELQTMPISFFPPPLLVAANAINSTTHLPRSIRSNSLWQKSCRENKKRGEVNQKQECPVWISGVSPFWIPKMRCGLICKAATIGRA
jgi:hypothetical protein